MHLATFLHKYCSLGFLFNFATAYHKLLCMLKKKPISSPMLKLTTKNQLITGFEESDLIGI